MRLFTHFLCIISLLIATNFASATHFMGSDMSWTCLGNNQYEVTVNVYKDCGGIALSAPTLDAKCAQTNQSIATVSNSNNPTPVDVTPTCPDIPCNTCDNGWSQGSCPQFPFGIAKYTYKYQLDLSNSNVPSGCCDITLSWSGCCRDSDITTGPNDENFYTEATLNRCVQPCDNSPVFNNEPLAIVCKDQGVKYNFGLSDPDTTANGQSSDSLVIDWAQPLKGPGSPATYNNPYAYDHPIEFQGFPNNNAPFPNGLHLDATTGELKFLPTKQQQTVMAFKVKEYRNGSKIGEVRRDMQVIVRNCPANTPPKLTGIEGRFTNRKWLKETYEKEPVNITIDSRDTNMTPNPDTVNISFDTGSIPGNPSWNDNSGDAGVRLPTGNFSWTPPQGSGRSKPYQFLVKAEDDACPVPGTTIRSYQIKVHPIPEADYNIQSLGCGKYKFTATSANNNLNYQWMGDGGINSSKQTFTHQFDSAGTYVVDLSVSDGIIKTYSDTINVPKLIEIDIGNDTVICKGDDITLGNTAQYASGPVTYQWHDGKNGQVRTFNDLTKDTTVHLSVSDTFCSSTDTVQVKIQDPPQVRIADRRICGNANPTIDPVVRKNFNKVFPDWIYLHQGRDDIINSYQWMGPNSNMVTSTDSLFTPTDTGTYILEIQDNVGCSGSDTFAVTENPKLDSSIDTQDICMGDSSKLVSPVIGGSGATYTWINQLTGDTSYGQSVKVPTQTKADRLYELRVVEQQGGTTCGDTFNVPVRVNTKPNINFATLPDSCSNHASFDLSPYATPDQGTWTTDAGNNSIVLNEFFPERAGAGKHELHYQYTDPTSKCTNIDTTSITVHADPLKPKIAERNDTLISSTETQNYQWYRNDTLLSNANNRTYHVTNEGNFQVKTWYDSNCTAISDTFHHEPSSGSSGMAKGSLKSIQVYPNPNQGTFTIEGSKFQNDALQVSIHNSLGKEVWREQYQILFQDFKRTINLKQVPAGVYFMKLKTSQSRELARIMIK